MRAAATGLLVAAAISGCLASPGDLAQGDAPQAPADVWGAVRALLAGVPCEVASVGEETTSNLVQLANLGFNHGRGSAEIDVRGDRLLAVGRGIQIVNVSDPLRPVLLGNYTEAGGGDVKFSPDGMTAVTGSRDAQEIRLIDIRDPEEPVEVGRWPLPPIDGPFQNVHMLATARIAERDWVFLAPNSGTGVWILRLDGPPEARTLTRVAQTLPFEGGPLGPHDMFVHHDADLDKWLLYSADGFHGWMVFDVTDPARPLPLGGFVHASAGYTHTIQAAKVGARRLVVTSEEVGVNVLKVYDATNLAAPVLLATWQVSAGTREPEHNLQIVAGKLYLAHYLHGIYVFDLARVGAPPLLGTLDVAPMAHYASGESTAIGPVGVLEGFGGFWDVVLQDGILYGSHMGNGLHAVGFGCNVPGDAALTSVG